MTSSGVNLFHLPSETTNNEVKFSPSTGDGSEDEDYSASLSAVLRQRRASVRRSRKGRARRSSSPFLTDESRSRRRSSVFTTSSGDTAISIEDQPIVTQEQIFENIHLHKEVLGSVKQQPLGMRRKLKIVQQAKGYIKRHEGQLQERLAQSKSTRDIYARFNILLATKWQQLKREAANTSNLFIPWELRIKEIESHFGSVVASYFTFLRWLFWVNLVIGFILLVFVIIPEYLTANPAEDGERKAIMDDESLNATNLLTLWEFEGVLKQSPIFYGYYSNVERPEYRMPLAYFLTGLAVYIYSFVATLRKMAENSRMSKLSEKEDECIFSWKLFTGWDFMIGNTETAHNRIASVILGFKEALLEEAEKKKNLRNWRIISSRTLVNICVIILLAMSAYAVVTVVSRSDDNLKVRSWWRENETTIVVTVISIMFPVLFELLGFFEHYHPRKQLRLQLARIMVLNLLNLYSLIFALFRKIEGMSNELDRLQPKLHMNVTIVTENTYNNSELLGLYKACFETAVPCLPCDMLNVQKPDKENSRVNNKNQSFDYALSNVGIVTENVKNKTMIKKRNLRYIEIAENLTQNNNNNSYAEEKISLLKEIERIHNLSKLTQSEDYNDTLETEDTESYDFSDDLYHSTDTTLITETEHDYKSSVSTLDSTYSEPNINSETNNILPPITESFYSTQTTEPQVFLIHSTLDTEVTFTATNTDLYQDTYTNADTTNTNIEDLKKNNTNFTMIDTVYFDKCHRKMYNLTIGTKKKLLKLCWETMFGQELVKLTMMDLVFVLLGTLFLDFFRALFVRYMNKCWCWDLEKKFPEYGDFKIAENILHLINNQGMVWMGMFFSPGLVVLNIFKLMIMMYLRSWAVMTCNVPHEVVFRVSKSNNFYLALLLTMLFLCVLPVGYTIVWVTPSWHCGPFSEYEKIYKILTNKMYEVLPQSLNFALEYIASPAIVIPLLVLLILIIYYLTSLTNSLREANNDLKIQLRRERTEERRKMFQLADTRRRAGSSSIENTPFTRWKKALPYLPLTKSIESDDRKTTINDTIENKTIKKKGGIFARIVGLAIDRKSNGEPVSDGHPSSHNIDEETDTDFHETLPKEVLKIKDITFNKNVEVKKKPNVEFKTEVSTESKPISEIMAKNCIPEKIMKRSPDINDVKDNIASDKCVLKKKKSNDHCIQKKQSSESSNLSKQTDSIGSVIPVITISTTESDDEILQTINNEQKIINENQNEKNNEKVAESVTNKNPKSNLKRNRNCSDLKSLQRQSSVDSINENKSPKECEDTGHKYQYSL
ncbi:transmembrane channel-like protein [Melitaea cinxia]|uniref:transmembrane channel-like protein n=1 Tax=Melitaea cinxia TaxID=113334 RepID=UPI001E271B37|nr:transmembrane channel-like protein [Melitaea cinxia]